MQDSPSPSAFFPAITISTTHAHVLPGKAQQQYVHEKNGLFLSLHLLLLFPQGMFACLLAMKTNLNKLSLKLRQSLEGNIKSWSKQGFQQSMDGALYILSDPSKADKKINKIVKYIPTEQSRRPVSHSRQVSCKYQLLHLLQASHTLCPLSTQAYESVQRTANVFREHTFLNT